jgi:hypothetical protein
MKFSAHAYISYQIIGLVFLNPSSPCSDLTKFCHSLLQNQATHTFIFTKKLPINANIVS